MNILTEINPLTLSVSMTSCPWTGDDSNESQLDWWSW
jgi:hypothetical protein